MGSDDDERSGDKGDIKLRVLQVTNISPSATREQVFNLFSYIGRVEECKVYPSETNLTMCKQKFAYIRYEDQKSVEVGQHLTNTVFIDRAIICIPSIDGVIPDEQTCLSLGGPAMPGQRQLPIHVVNTVQDMGDGSKMLLTVDPTLMQLGLPPYPPLSAETDTAKVEEIRRTVYVGNLPKDVTGQEIADFFNMIGEVMYVRMTVSSDSLPCAYAFVEFSQQPSVPLALQNNGIEFRGRQLRIQHSRVAILKPQNKTVDQAREEVEEIIRRNKDEDAKNAPPPGSARMGVITTSSVDSHRKRTPSPVRSRRRSDSRSPVRRRSRTRSPRRRDRSRSRDRRRSSRERSDRKRSRSRNNRDRDRDRDRGDRDRKKRSRSRSRDRRDKDRDRDRSRDRKRDRKRSKSRSRSKDRKKSRSRSRSRDRKDKDRKRDRDRSSERRKDRDDKKRDEKKKKEDKKVKSESESEDDEILIRQRLLAKVAERNGSVDKKDDENGSTVKMEQD